jgi:hypothetical protein
MSSPKKTQRITKRPGRAAHGSLHRHCSAPYSEQWWKELEAGRTDMARAFGAETRVMSQMAFRAAVVEAIGRMRAQNSGMQRARSGAYIIGISPAPAQQSRVLVAWQSLA